MIEMNNKKSYKPLPNIYCIRYKGESECDPRKCTAIKLKKFNLLKIIPSLRSSLKRAIILNPFSQNELSADDRDLILKYGLIVLDISWKNLLKLRDLKGFKETNGRRLPSLIAANPVNYGKWEKLNSAEAIAAALFITRFEEAAHLILSKFSWGEEFIKINNLK